MRKLSKKKDAEETGKYVQLHSAAWDGYSNRAIAKTASVPGMAFGKEWVVHGRSRGLHRLQLLAFW
jgi:hypothetical protein